MYFVCELPNRVVCLAKKGDTLPDGSCTFGDDSGYYEDGKIASQFKDLPKYSEKLLKIEPTPE